MCVKNRYVIIFLIVLLSLAGCQGVAHQEQGGTHGEEAVTADKAMENSSLSEYEEGSLLSPDRILNIAHRGASGHAPEHTMASYEKVAEMNADYIEIDLQMTRDGALIAMHDSDVSRTTDGEGHVSELTIDDIEELDAGEWFNEENPDLAIPAFSQAPVPTLDEIFETFGKDANYYIETKNPDDSPNMVKELIAALDRHDMLDDDMEEGQVIIQSFSEASLKEVQQLAPSLPLIQLISYQEQAKITEEELERIAEYAIGIGANYKHLTKEYMQHVRDAGFLLHPYTVNEKKDMKRMIKWGATGMFTDYPDRLEDVLKELQL